MLFPSTIAPLIILTACFAEKGARWRSGVVSWIRGLSPITRRGVNLQKLAFWLAVSVWHYCLLPPVTADSEGFNDEQQFVAGESHRFWRRHPGAYRVPYPGCRAATRRGWRRADEHIQ